MSADLIDLAENNRQVARELAAAERERIAATQRTADADAAARRRQRDREDKLRLDRERTADAEARKERRELQRAKKAEDRRARRAARRARAAAWRAARVAYVRGNAAAVFSATVYGQAVAGALWGQVTAAMEHGLPGLLGVSAAIAIEGFGLSMALTGQELRLARERALAPRTLVWAATALAMTINYRGHEGFTGQILAALSLIGIVVYEIRSAAKHRKALRKAGMLPAPPEQFGARRWVLHFRSTFAAWRVDARDRVSPRAAELIAVAEQERAARDELAAAERAEQQRRVQAEQVMALARRAARKAARKGDAGGALAALMHLAVDGKPPVQRELPAAATPVDDDVRQLCDLVRSQARGARVRLVGSAPAVAPVRPVALRVVAAPAEPGRDEPTHRVGASTQTGSAEPTQRGAGESGQPGAAESTHGGKSTHGVTAESGAGESAQAGAGESARRRAGSSGAPASRRTAAAAGGSRAARVTAPVRSKAETDAVLAAAFEQLRAELEREPSGAELAERTGLGKATANRWKSNREKGTSK